METAEILKRIEFWSNQKALTMYAVAKKSGLSMTTLYNMRERSTKPSIDTLEKICIGLDITLAQFFSDEKAVLELTDSERKIVGKFRRLNDSKRERLISYLDGLSVI